MKYFNQVQPLEELEVISIGCPNPPDLQRLVESIVAADLPIWSLRFINPRMAELKNRAPLMKHNGHPVEERVLLPAAYLMTLAYRKKDRDSVTGKLPGLLKQCEAEILSERIAEHEWQNRFKLMVVKRLGPYLVPAEVVIPYRHGQRPLARRGGGEFHLPGAQGELLCNSCTGRRQMGRVRGDNEEEHPGGKRGRC